MFAVFKLGGKQYKVKKNDVINVEKLSGLSNQEIKLNQVLVVVDDEYIQVGCPLVDQAIVHAKILAQTKDKKILVFKKRRRQNYRRKNGHRQEITVLRIMDITYW